MRAFYLEEEEGDGAPRVEYVEVELLIYLRVVHFFVHLCTVEGLRIQSERLRTQTEGLGI